MLCKKCKKEIDENSVFCKYCGRKISFNKTEKAQMCKKEYVRNVLCNYMLNSAVISGTDPHFSDLETYEEGQNGEIYVELVATTQNVLIQKKQTRYGAVIKEFNENGTYFCKPEGLQIINNITPTKTVKKTLGFKKAPDT